MSNTRVECKAKILVLITARGGSKRLPNKNILPLGGRPLIGWTIELARQYFDKSNVLVSTDDEKIATVARECGASVPWLRPTSLATDTASSIDVTLHALEWYENNVGRVDGLLLLQPTSPFRSGNSIMRAIELFNEKGRRPVVSVSPAGTHPLWTFKVEGDQLTPYFSGDGIDKRSQDLPPAYSLNGSLYLITPSDLKRAHSFVTSATVPLVIESPFEAMDIDTPFDMEMAQVFVNAHRHASL